MAVHIMTMNLAAPMIVLALRRYLPPTRHHLAAATALQVALIWGVHLPTALAFTHETAVAMVAVQSLLLLAALWFWHEVIAEVGDRRWRAIFALLISGKLFCLLGALLVFAPRPLYALSGHGAHLMHDPVTALDDQQMAGLLMLTACPLTFVVAAVIVAGRWILAIERRPIESVG